MLSLLSFGAREFFGITLGYILSGALIAGGLYLAAFFNLAATNPVAWLLAPLRYVGYALVAAGIFVGAVTYGKSVGATDCIAASRVAALEQENASLKRDLNAQRAAVAAKEDETRALAEQKKAADAQLVDWQNYANSLSASAATCRHASDDDDRRLCRIVGNASAGCKPAR